MTVMQRLIYNLLPDAERHSRSWVFRCPTCRRETSVHDMGGVRYKAFGKPIRLLSCTHCNWFGFAPMYKRDSPLLDGDAPLPTETMVDKTDSPDTRAELSTYPMQPQSSAKLWIDGVGCWLVHWGDVLHLAGPGSDARGSSLSFNADLSRRHAVLRRREDDHVLEPIGRTTLNGKPLDREAFLKNGDTLGLGADVKLRYLKPSNLSTTGVLEFVAGPRTTSRLDGVILLDRNCVLGAGDDAHIKCRGWERQVVLFLKGNALWCRPDATLSLDDKPLSSAQELVHGSVLTGDNWRMRVEVD